MEIICEMLKAMSICSVWSYFVTGTAIIIWIW